MMDSWLIRFSHAVCPTPTNRSCVCRFPTQDLVLANKCDLATEQELRNTLNACRALNERAAIVSTTFGDAELGDVLPKRAASVAAVTEEKRAICNEYTFLLNGLNCGGCGNAVRKALMAVDGVAEVCSPRPAEALQSTRRDGHPPPLLR